MRCSSHGRRSPRRLPMAADRRARSLGARPLGFPMFCDSSPRGGDTSMPIRASLRWFYPIDWPQLSREIRFGRAKGRCEVCNRRHKTKVLCLPDGRWFDRDDTCWHDGHGNRCVPPWGSDLDRLRTTHVILAAAHLDHDPAHCGRKHRNVRALCQRSAPRPTGASAADQTHDS